MSRFAIGGRGNTFTTARTLQFCFIFILFYHGMYIMNAEKNDALPVVMTYVIAYCL